MSYRYSENVTIIKPLNLGDLITAIQMMTGIDKTWCICSITEVFLYIDQALYLAYFFWL